MVPSHVLSEFAAARDLVAFQDAVVRVQLAELPVHEMIQAQEEVRVETGELELPVVSDHRGVEPTLMVHLQIQLPAPGQYPGLHDSLHQGTRRRPL